MIVDDNVFNIMTLQCILSEGFGMEADQALNGLEAFEAVKKR